MDNIRPYSLFNLMFPIEMLNFTQSVHFRASRDDEILYLAY